ncbi:MAG: glycosyltransferase family 4 protein [Acidobacteriota bacterium]
MKILQVCSASEMGGGEVHVADLARSLASRGHAVYLAVRPESLLRAPLAGVIASWHELPLRNSLDMQSARAMADIINHHRIDIIHAHVGRDYLVSAFACRRTDARLILTRHHYLPLKRNLIYRLMLQDTAAVIAVSDSVRESVVERLAIPAERVHTIPNWIDTSRFRPIDREAARSLFQFRSSLVVACIGQITPAKGQEEFIRAAARAVTMRPDIHFVIAGEEKEEGSPFTQHLIRLVDTLGLSGKVSFLGHVHHIPELLAAVDVVVVPSWDEGFSLVTIEAMAAGRAVMASNVGGMAGIIAENTTGLLFPPRDSKAMAEKLLWLLWDTGMRERLGHQAQREVSEKFGRDQVIDRIESLYFEVLGAGQYREEYG